MENVKKAVKNGTGLSIAQTQGQATPTLLLTPQAEKAETGTPPTPPESLPSTPTLLVQQKTVNTVFEKVRAIRTLQDQYQNFAKKLEELESFRSKVDGTAISLTVENAQGFTVEFNNLNIIVEFLDLAISRGKDHKDKMENSILHFQL